MPVSAARPARTVPAPPAPRPRASQHSSSSSSSCCACSSAGRIIATVVKALFLTLTAGLLGVLACILILTNDYVAAAVCLMFFWCLGLAALVFFWQCMDARNDRNNTHRARAPTDAVVQAELARYERAYPALTLSEDMDVEAGAADEAAVYAATEPCAVCLESMCGNQCRVLHCKHAFHVQCIDEWWLRKRDNLLRCPMCRREQPIHLRMAVQQVNV